MLNTGFAILLVIYSNCILDAVPIIKPSPDTLCVVTASYGVEMATMQSCQAAANAIVQGLRSKTDEIGVIAACVAK